MITIIPRKSNRNFKTLLKLKKDNSQVYIMLKLKRFKLLDIQLMKIISAIFSFLVHIFETSRQVYIFAAKTFVNNKNRNKVKNMEEYKLINGALMRKYPSVPARMFINVRDTLSGGKQV